MTNTATQPTTDELTFEVHLFSDCGDPILRDDTVMVSRVTCNRCLARYSR